MKKITIVFILLSIVLVSGVGYLVYRNNQGDTSNVTSEGVEADVTFYKTKQECEQQSGKKCSGPQQCDYIPEGKTLEEVCGRGFFKGAYIPIVR